MQRFPIGSVYPICGNIYFTINIPQRLAYIPCILWASGWTKTSGICARRVRNAWPRVGAEFLEALRWGWALMKEKEMKISIMGYPKNGGFLRENPMKMDDDWGYSPFQETPK